VAKETTKEALRYKIDHLNNQIEELVQERDALLRMYIGDFNEVITDAEYVVLALDDRSTKR
jgi:hypothetical protein